MGAFVARRPVSSVRWKGVAHAVVAGPDAWKAAADTYLAELEVVAKLGHFTLSTLFSKDPVQKILNPNLPVYSIHRFF